MKNYILQLLLLCCIACQKEELEPSYTPNPFAPAPNATDKTSQLRRDFYEATKCFLLFNDTLRHEYQGLDQSGNPYYETEVLALEWNVGTTSYSRYQFEYIRDLQKQEEVFLFLKDELYPIIKQMMPYSILAVNHIDTYDISTSELEYVSSPNIVVNTRCLALDISGLWETDNKTVLAQEVFATLLFSSWGGTPPYYEDSKAYDFLSYNLYDYGYPKYYYGLPEGLDLNEEDMAMMYSYGFIANTSASMMPSAQEDAVSYIVACLTMTEEEFQNKYGMYHTVMTKYELIKPLVDATNMKTE